MIDALEMPVRPEAAARRPSPLRIEVGELAAAEERRWDAYVRRHPAATPFHLLGWRRVVERGLRHPTVYLVARRAGRLAGVLPLGHVRSLLFGRSLVSLPAAVGGGPLADDDETRRALLATARRRAESLAVDYLELRTEDADPADGMPVKDLYVTFRTDLRRGEEELLGRMGRKRRQMMSYVDRAGYRGRFTGIEELPRFYRLFSRSMRSHGTPVYARRYLAEILRAYPGESRLYFAEHEGDTVAGVLVLLCGRTVLPFYAGTDRERRLRGIDEFLYWSLMRWGREHGFETFDFGRSKRGTGAWKFKSRWGMDEVPLAYQYHLVRAGEVPNVSPANPRFARAIDLWRRLPLPVTQAIGPAIVRRIP